MTTDQAAEPYCNHDPAAVRNGVCECGTVVGTITGCGIHPTIGNPFCSICRAHGARMVGEPDSA